MYMMRYHTNITLYHAKMTALVMLNNLCAALELAVD